MKVGRLITPTKQRCEGCYLWDYVHGTCNWSPRRKRIGGDYPLCYTPLNIDLWESLYKGRIDSRQAIILQQRHYEV